MDIRVLNYFLTVARVGNITKAAELLHMTQPPLSRQLKELEDELGKKLLIRGSKRVTLTEDGMLLRKRAEELVELMEKTKAELSASDESVVGDIHIGAGETDAISIIAQAAMQLRDEYPSIRYHISSGDAAYVTDRLEKGLIDFGLLVEPVDVAKYDYICLNQRDTWGVLMRRDSELAKKSSITAEDLWDKPLILSRQSIDSSDLSAWMNRDIEKLNVVSTYELIYNASHFVKKGLGYAVTLDKLVNTTGESELCFRPMYPTFEAGLCIVWKKYQVFSRAAECFLEKLQEVISRSEEL